MTDVLDAAKAIMQATKILEHTPRRPGSRHAACLQLAWHHLMDAHALLTVGRITPDDLVWAEEKIKEGETDAR